MKKKLLGLLIVLALIVVMIPILASAEEATATVKFANTTELTVTRGGEAKYLKNAANGTVSAGTQGNHTVEFVYPTGGVPTIYLRDAYLNSGVYGIESISNAADSALIIVEKIAAPTAKNGVEGVDSYLAAPIKWTHGNLEIRGYAGETAPTNLADMAKLKLTSQYDGLYCSTSVTFKAVDLNMQATVSGKKGISSSPSLVEFYGGKAVIDSHDIAVYIPGATAQGLIVDGGADVTLHSVNHNTVYLDGSSAVINVKDGKLSMTGDRSSHPAVRTTNASSVLIKKGTLEFNGLTGVDALIDLTTYQNPVGENYYHTSYIYQGEPGVDTREKVHPSWYSYIKIEPAYAVAVTGGNADVAKAPVGATVTLTPGAVDGKTFNGWTSDDVTITENEGVYTFTMPAKNVAVAASFVKQTMIKLNGVDDADCTFTDAEPKYFTTNGETGAITKYTASDAEEKYNIKLAYNGDVPTVYLRDAIIKAENVAIESAGAFDIVTEADSTITQTAAGVQTPDTKYAAIKASGKVTFRGTALLRVEGRENVIYGNSGASLEFNNANVEIEKAAGTTWGDAAIAGSVSAMTFIDSDVNILCNYIALYCGGVNISVQGDSNVTIKSTGNVVTYGAGDIVVDGGYLKVQGKAGGTGVYSAYPVLHNAGSLTVNGGTFEAYNEGDNQVEANGNGDDVLNKVPTLFEGSYAIMGSSKATATQYTAGSTISGQYFKVGTAYTVTVTGDNSTAKAYGMDPATTVKAFVGDEVALSATAPTGQILTNWEVTAGTAIVNNSTLTMSAGDVTVKANFGYGASITIGNYDYTVVKGGAAMYFKTDANGAVTVAGDDSDYNMMFVYANDTDAVPTLYLRNAYVASDIKSNAATLANTIIIVEDTASGKVVTAGGEISADAYLTGVVTWEHGDLEVRGLGKLMMTKQFDVKGKALTFKDVDLVMDGGRVFVGSPTLITFDGGKADLTCSYALVFITNASETINGVKVTGNADVTMTSTGNTTIYYQDAVNAKILVESGKLKVVSESASHEALRLKTLTNLVVTGGILELQSPNAATSGAVMPDLTGYKNALGENVYYASVTKQADYSGMGKYDEVQALYGFKRFKVEPAFKITVNGDATANYATAPVDTVVKLTPKNIAGKKLDSFTSGDVTIDNNEGVYTFVMPNKNVSVTANFVDDPDADGEPNEVVFSFAGKKVMLTRGQTKYFITAADGTIKEDGATEDNYNIKIVYETTKGKTPVIHLRGAYLKGSYGSIINNDYGSLCTNNERASKVTIVVEKELGNATSAVPADVTADSYLVSYIYLSKGDVEIQGPGKLVIDKVPTSDSFIAGGIQAGGNLTFKDADIEVLTGGLTGKNITFDGGKVVVTNRAIPGKPDGQEGGLVVSVYENPYVILVKNNAQVTLTSVDRAVMHIVGTAQAPAALQIESGNLVLKSTATGRDTQRAALKMVNAKLKMSGGTLEIFGAVTVVTGDIAMDLTGNFDAVCANNVEGTGTVDYNLLPTLKQYNSSWQLKYFKIQPGTGSGSGNAGGNGGSTSSHTHSTTKVSGKAASCTADGVKEHYKCSCGKFFEDKAAKKEIKDINTWKVIKATGHKDANKDGKCDTCKAAQTSDSSFNALWITLLTVSALGLCVTFVYNKKMRATK